MGIADQVREPGAGTTGVTATVGSIPTLVLWLCGFGARGVVHGPQKLRDEMRELAHAMAAG